MSQFYVYHLIDPRCDEVFYVGKGQGDRIDAHEKEAKAGSGHPKCDVIRGIWADGHQVLKTKVKHFKDEQAAYDFEAQEVDRIGLAHLTNLCAGGGSVRSLKERAWEPIDSARKILNAIALVIRLKAAGKTFNQPWEGAIAKMMPHSLKRLAEKYGVDFVQSELAKYAVDIVFASKVDAVRAAHG